MMDIKIAFDNNYDNIDRESGYTGYERQGSCDGYSVDTSNDSNFLGQYTGKTLLLDVDIFFIGHGY